MKLSADNIRPLLDKMPKNVVARLPYPHKTDAINSQGAALTGTEDMQTLAYDDTDVKIGVIGLSFSSRSTSLTTGVLPTGLTITDHTCTCAGVIYIISET